MRFILEERRSLDNFVWHGWKEVIWKYHNVRSDTQNINVSFLHKYWIAPFLIYSTTLNDTSFLFHFPNFYHSVLVNSINTVVSLSVSDHFLSNSVWNCSGSRYWTFSENKFLNASLFECALELLDTFLDNVYIRKKVLMCRDARSIIGAIRRCTKARNS